VIFCWLCFPQVVQKQTSGEVGNWMVIWWQAASGIFVPKIIKNLIIGFQVTVENVGNVLFWDTVYKHRQQWQITGMHTKQWRSQEETQGNATPSSILEREHHSPTHCQDKKNSYTVMFPQIGLQRHKMSKFCTSSHASSRIKGVYF